MSFFILMPSSIVICVARCPGILLSGKSNGEILVTKEATGAIIFKLNNNGKSVECIDVSHDGKRAVTGSGDGSIRIWDLQKGKCISVMTDERSVYCVAISKNGKTVVSGGFGYSASIWRDGHRTHLLSGHTHSLRSVAIYNNDIIATGSSDKTIRLWSASTGAPLKVLKGTENFFEHVSYWTNDYFDVEVGEDEELPVEQDVNGDILACCFSPCGNYLASGSADSTVRIWDVKSGDLLQVLKGHASIVYSVCYSSNGRYIVSGGEDATLRIWDTVSGQNVKTFNNEKHTVYSCVFVKDDKEIMYNCANDIKYSLV